MYPSVRHIEENGVQCICGRSFLQRTELVDYLVVVIGKSASVGHQVIVDNCDAAFSPRLLNLAMVY